MKPPRPTEAELDAILSGQQCTNARALLGWPLYSAGVYCGVSEMTIRRLEAGLRVTAAFRLRIRERLEAAGVEFAGDDVRLRK